MTERKRRSRRRGTWRNHCVQAKSKREKTAVETVLGDPNEPPSADPTANTAGNHSQNGSQSLSNRFVFRF